MNVKNIKKIYYSIGEVSQMTSVKKHVLRSWEADFFELRPAKNRYGNRIYRDNDIKTIFHIKKLLYEEKYTIDGAKQKLRNSKKANDSQGSSSLTNLKQKDVLMKIKRELHELLGFIKKQSASNDAK